MILLLFCAPSVAPKFDETQHLLWGLTGEHNKQNSNKYTGFFGDLAVRFPIIFFLHLHNAKKSTLRTIHVFIKLFFWVWKIYGLDKVK
jgi:hypothetical protein